MMNSAEQSGIKALIDLPRPRHLLAPLLALQLVACQGTLPNAGSEGVSFKVGENAIGETCSLVSNPTAGDLAENTSAYEIFCGEWEQPSAQLYRTVDSGDLTQLAMTGPWREQLDNQVNCDPPIETAILAGLPALALDCTLRVGGWPYQALVTQIGAETFFADSLPTTYPVVEHSIGILSGQTAPDQAREQGSLSNEIQRLESRLAGAAYSAGDLQRYRDLLRLGQYYNFQGLFPEAEKRYREALSIHEQVLPGDKGGLGFLYIHIALQLSNQERFGEADALFDQAEKLLRYSLEPTDEATLVSYRAIHLANQRQNKGALSLAREATQSRRELAQQLGYSFPDTSPATVSGERAEFAAFTPKEMNTSDVLITRGASAFGDVVQSQSVEAAMLIEAGQLDAAERILTEASMILAREPRVPRRWVPKILLQQARVAELRGNLAAAERLLTEAITAQQALFSESRTEGLAYVALGRVYAGQDRLPEALETFGNGFDIIAKRGGGLLFNEAMPYFRAGLLQAKRDPTQRISIHTEMFKVGQMIRGPVTAQWMARTAARLATGDQQVSALIRELEATRRKRDRLREQLTVAQADLNVLAPQIEALEVEWQTADEQIASLERQVQAAAPRYNQLVDAPVSADDVLGSLRPGEALVQVLLGANTSIGFFIDSDGIEVFQIDLSEQQARRIVSNLRAPFETFDGLIEFPVADAHAFYVQLFSPVSERLAKAEHVVTIPSGPLLSLPFGLFVTEPPPKIVSHDYSQVAWMARRQALTLTPSVQSFVNLRQTVTPSKAGQALIGFGDFVPHRNADAVLATLGLPESCREQAMLIAELSRLPGTGEEIRAVADSIGASDDALFLGTAFSEEAVKQTNLADYRIVYFATHGLLPHKLNCLPQPALAMSISTRDESLSDGLLLTEEVVEELALDADLVVLSACDTGGPENETGGESLSGLARAFFYAGARSMLVSHWEVPDKPTMRLLTGTFERLTSENLALADALRKSQIALMDSPPLSHPLAWAGFTVVGDGGLHLSHQPSKPLRTAATGDLTAGRY